MVDEELWLEFRAYCIQKNSTVEKEMALRLKEG